MKGHEALIVWVLGEMMKKKKRSVKGIGSVGYKSWRTDCKD